MLLFYISDALLNETKGKNYENKYDINEGLYRREYKYDINEWLYRRENKSENYINYSSDYEINFWF